MLAFTDVMHLLADEFARLRARRLAGTLVCTGAFDRFLLGHISPPMERADATAMPSRPLDTLVETDRKGMAFCQPHPKQLMAQLA